MPYKPLSREHVIDAIQRFAAMHGRPPTSSEWLYADKVNNFPNINACVGKRGHAFATFTDAIRAAGFNPIVQGQHSYDYARIPKANTVEQRRAEQQHALHLALERNGR